MTSAFLIAAAFAPGLMLAGGFDNPLPDADLASSVSHVQQFPIMVGNLFFRTDRMLTNDQMDVWWSEDGMLLIAESVRPAPTVPGWLNPEALRGGGLAIRFDRSVSQTTRP